MPKRTLGISQVRVGGVRTIIGAGIQVLLGAAKGGPPVTNPCGSYAKRTALGGVA